MGKLASRWHDRGYARCPKCGREYTAYDKHFKAGNHAICKGQCAIRVIRGLCWACGREK